MDAKLQEQTRQAAEDREIGQKLRRIFELLGLPQARAVSFVRWLAKTLEQKGKGTT